MLGCTFGFGQDTAIQSLQLPIVIVMKHSAHFEETSIYAYYAQGFQTPIVGTTSENIRALNVSDRTC